MRNKVDIVALCLLAVGSQSARAFDVPPDSIVRVGGRLDYRLEAAREAAPFPWNYSSRGVADMSRFMFELGVGGRRYGELYLKAAAEWNAPRTESGAVGLGFEQGDYLWRRERPGLAGPAAPAARSFEFRLFANERRYFTGELSNALLDDDVVSREDHHFGLRHDGRSGSVQWTALGAMLGNRWEEADGLLYLRGARSGRRIGFSVAYLAESTGRDSIENSAVVKAELSAAYKRFSAILSWEQSGVSDQAIFLPSGSFDWDRFDGDNLSSAISDGAAASAELRLFRVPMRDWGHWSLVYRYQTVGSDYANELGALRRAEVSSTSGLYFSARTVSVDGRIVYSDRERFRIDDHESECLEASVRALLVDATEVFLRTAAVRVRDGELPEATREFVHAAVRREGSKVRSGVHMMLANVEDGTLRQRLEERFGVEAKLNLTAQVSLYGRLITGQSISSGEAIYWRFELRPVAHVFATIGYGRDWIGDGPYLLEDADSARIGESEAVYFVTVRGDF
jgi:hypothetical protein